MLSYAKSEQACCTREQQTGLHTRSHSICLQLPFTAGNPILSLGMGQGCSMRTGCLLRHALIEACGSGMLQALMQPSLPVYGSLHTRCCVDHHPQVPQDAIAQPLTHGPGPPLHMQDCFRCLPARFAERCPHFAYHLWAGVPLALSPSGWHKPSLQICSSCHL